MKCPYNTAINQSEQTVFTHEDGELVFQQTVVTQEIVWPECLKEDCAAWEPDFTEQTTCDYFGKATTKRIYLGTGQCGYKG